MTAPAVRVAIVGGGPSGFYAAEALLRSGRELAVDMFERLPAPFGLVRYGVAPDHPKLKKVTAVFDRIAAMPGFRFFGGVPIGGDVALGDLQRGYHAVILATGADVSRALEIPGQTLSGSHSAGDFVGWYNGHPDFRDCRFNLDAETAVVVGHGNVALDVARILVKTADELRHTDIAAHALEALAESRVREVHVVGRRGPAQTKFSESELSEFANLADCDTVVASEDREAAGSRPESTGILALIEAFGRSPGLKRRRCVLRFHLTPAKLEGDGRVERIVFNRTPAGATTIACGLVFASIGRRAARIAGAPYDAELGVHANIGGRIAPGLYVCGWSKRGPSGTIGTNRACSLATVEAVLADLPERAGCGLDDPDALITRLGAHVSFAGWSKIDAAETARGVSVGKPREKFVSVADMFRAAQY